MKTILLTQGFETVVDDEDFEWLNQWKWHVKYSKKKGRTCYAKRNSILMHRVIGNIPQGFYTDHIDGNGLNNQKKNLRYCTNLENSRNRKITKINTSGFKGVSFHKRERKWGAQIYVNKKLIYLGFFKTPELAAHKYNEAALKYFGEFARLNKIDSCPD